MPGLILRTLITALALGVAAWLVPGIAVTGVGTLLVAALLMGLVNALIRPLVVLLTLPLTILTLGLFLLVVNASMFALVAALLDGFRVAGFPAALFGSIVVSLVGGVLSWTIGASGRYELIVVERRRP